VKAPYLARTEQSQNMAEGGVSRSSNEQERLGQSAKEQQKYGTASKTPCSAAAPDLFIKHFVQRDETLPGIALKYGRTVRRSLLQI